MREVWIKETEDGYKELSRAELKEESEKLYELLAEYQTSYSYGEYVVGQKHEADKQSVTVNNTLSGSKDILWHKQWMDAYTYENGQRPDIYLNIYRTYHQETNDGQVQTVTELFQKNYKWEYIEGLEDLDGKYDKQHHWHAIFYDLPKYDALGYEIQYYATEHTEILAGDFDYQPVEYSVPDPDAEDTEAMKPIGTEYEITDSGSAQGPAYVQKISSAGETDHYALIEGGTFTNCLANEVTIQGQKLWTALPNGYPQEDLPTVTFSLYQSLAKDSDGQEEPEEPPVGEEPSAGEETTPGEQPGETGTENPSEKEAVASVTVENWTDLLQNGSYIFKMEYVGSQTMQKNQGGETTCVPDNPKAEKLPKYDEEGNLYRYTLKESSIAWAEEIGEDKAEEIRDVFREPTVDPNTFLIDNVYDSVKAATAVKKYLKLPLDKNGAYTVFPAVTFVLERTYTTNEGKESATETVETVTWSSGEVKEAYDEALLKVPEGETFDGWVEVTLPFEDLEVYAPNGSEYQYSVREDKTNLNGYDTWAAKGDLEKDGQDNSNKVDASKEAEVSDLKLTPNAGDGTMSADIATAATFWNEQPEVPETVKLTGTKKWEDYQNIFGLRPDELELILTRSADAQPGQNNPVPAETVDAEEYEITWDKVTDKDSWTFTIEGKENSNELERYAPNGMPWKYQIREDTKALQEAAPSYQISREPFKREPMCRKEPSR